jgi:hypothetical protein
LDFIAEEEKMEYECCTSKNKLKEIRGESMNVEKMKEQVEHVISKMTTSGYRQTPNIPKLTFRTVKGAEDNG